MKKLAIALAFIFMTVVASAADTVYTTGRGVRIRSCAKTTCSIIVTLPSGSALTVLGTEQGTKVKGSTEWYNVSVDGHEGYVHSSLVSTTPPVVASNAGTGSTTATTTSSTVSAAPVAQGNGATALCNDGTYSYAAHHQGACSHHGGVSVFYK